ncbi:MAG: alpha/beta fold hydrolase [Acidobacteriota bacterium]
MLGLLGMAGLGFAASRLRRQAPVAEPTRRPRRRPRPIAAPVQRLELPDDAELVWLPAPDGSIAVAERNAAAKRTVLFVHGLGGMLEQWAPQLAALPPSVHGLAVDLPGHGRSDRPETVTVAGLAGALAAALDGVSARRAILVAHSFGALPALAYAARHPSRVEALLLIDPNGDQSRIGAADRRALLDAVRADAHGELEWTWRQLLADSAPAVAKEILTQLRATPPPMLLGCLEAAFSHSPLDDLDRLEVPVHLALSPLNDLPYSLQRLRPDLPLRILRGGHWLMLDRPDDVTRLLDELLARVAPAARRPARR